MSECSCQHIMREKEKERERAKWGDYTFCYRQGSSSEGFLSFFLMLSEN